MRTTGSVPPPAATATASAAAGTAAADTPAGREGECLRGLDGHLARCAASAPAAFGRLAVAAADDALTRRTSSALTALDRGPCDLLLVGGEVGGGDGTQVLLARPARAQRATLRRVGVVERATALGRGSKLLGHDCNGLRRLLRRATRPGVASTAGAAARAAAPKTAARAASASAVGERRGAGGGGHFERCTAASSFLTELRQIGRPRE